MFFFEKKNQKTFASFERAVRHRAPKVAKVFCFFFSKKKAFLPCLIIICAPPTLQAQPSAKPAVGANQIFSALVQPDRPLEVGLLRGLRDTLARKADAATLEAARAQVDTLLQTEEKRDGDMPPALVMSALASRMDAAVAGLEAARHVTPPPAPTPEKSWLVPGLAAAVGILALALVASLIALAGRAQPDEDTGDIRETLGKIKRRLDETAGGIGQALSLADTARGEASDAVQEAAAAVSRLGGAARDAETKLRGSVEQTEQRLHAAAAIAGEFEQWLESLPSRLSEVFDRAEASGSRHLESAASEIAERVARLAEVAESLPASQRALHNTIEALAQNDNASARALEELKAATCLAEETWPALIAAGVRTATEGMPSWGAQDSVEANRPILEAVTSLAARLERMGAAVPETVAQAVDRGVAQAMEQAAASLEAAGQIPERVSAHLQALQLRGAEAIDLAAARLAEAADAIVDKAADIPAAEKALQDGLASLKEAGKDKLGTLDTVSQVLDRQVLQLANLMGASRDAVALAAEAAQVSRADVDSAALRLSQAMDAAGALPEQVEALSGVVSRLQAAASDQPGHASLQMAAPSSEAVSGIQSVADRLLDTAARMERVLEAAELARARAMADALAAQASQAEGYEAVLEALSARADASLGALPAEASALAASAAELRADAALLGAAAERMEQASAGEARGAADGITPALEAVAAAIQRVEDELLRQRTIENASGEDAAALRAELQRTVSCLAAGETNLSMAARQVVTATDDAMAILAKGCAEAGNAVASSQHFLLDVQALLAEQAARMATILDSSEDVAVRLQACAAHEEDVSAEAAAAVRTESANAASFRAWEEERAALQNAISHVQSLVSHLMSGAEAKEAALARATEAASTVATLIASAGQRETAGEAGVPACVPDGVTLVQLTAMAKEAERLRHTTESMACSALQGQASALSPEIVSHVPALLAAIDTCIHQLRGAGTALALASDAHQKAA